MRNWRAQVRLWAFAAVAGVILTGCGSGDDADTAGSGEDGGSGDESSESPLSEYLGEGFHLDSGGMMAVSATNMAEMTDEEKQKVRQVEELVAQCMQDRGFEYVPSSPADTGSSPFDEAFSLEPGDFARQYGYGISTMGRMAPESEDEKDPNQKIREALSESAQKEYDAALWGDMAESVTSVDGSGVAVEAPAPGDDDGEPDEQGCQQQAGDEVFGGPDEQGRPDMSDFDGLFDDIATLQKRIDDDPRVAEAEQAWADCMAGEGYGEFATPAEAREEVMTRSMDLNGDGSGAAANEFGGPADDDAPEVDEAELEELQEYEIDVATADFDCGQEGYQDTYDEVSHELQEEFVEQHLDELERYRDAMASNDVGHAGGAA